MTFSDISISDILSDPINYVLLLVFVAALSAFLKYLWPRIVKAFLEVRGKLDSRVIAIAAAVLKAAEQARRKGDLNAWLAMFGVTIDLSNNDAIREAVVNRIQQELIERFSWGKLVKVSWITEMVLALMRDDVHKGAIHPLEELEAAGPEALLQYIPLGKLQDAVRLAESVQGGSGNGLVVANGPLPPSGSKRSRR